jgi:ATP-binding cassette subfamily B protein
MNHNQNVANILNALAGIYTDQGDYAEAARLAQRSVAIMVVAVVQHLSLPLSGRATPPAPQVQGPSGGGKSTLATLLTGLCLPESGLLLLGGLDRQTLGAAGWRQRVVAAPQFHDNHVFGGTFAFNLLMGRRWPPTSADLEQAETLCHAPGLRDLLQRMPAGRLQTDSAFSAGENAAAI